jgi:hypothetical protein
MDPFIKNMYNCRDFIYSDGKSRFADHVIKEGHEMETIDEKRAYCRPTHKGILAKNIH